MKYLFFLTPVLTAAAPVIAQTPDEAITVVATGTAQPLGQTGQSISVIGAAEIVAVQGPDLTRVLERLPGVALARSGPLGSQTSLFVRGANSQQLVVTLDGVRLADVAAPSAGFDIGTLTTAGIGKIELLRGSNSVVWGSDAIGGVLALTSAEFIGARAGIEYGANNTLTADAALGTSGNGYGLTVSGGHVRSDGISAYAPGGEPDGFRQWHGTVRGYADLGDDLRLVAAGRYADSRVDFDGFPPPLYSFADTPEYQTTRQGSGRLGLDYAGGSTVMKIGLAWSETRRDYFDDAASAAPNFATQGRSWRADFSGKAQLSEAVTLNFGVDSEWTRFATSFDAARDARLSSAHLLLGYHAGSLHLSAGARLDDHDRFGTHGTFGANGVIGLTADLRLRASYGEGFKAPALYQLYGFGGNRALQPETSQAYEAGLEYGTRSGEGYLAVTLYRRTSRNLIDYVSCFRDPASGGTACRSLGVYENIGRVVARGVELEGQAQLGDRVRARLAYTLGESVNRSARSLDFGRDLARRPHHLLSAGLDWESPLAGLTLGADLRLVGDSFDDPGNRTRLDGHGLLTLRADLPLGQGFALYGRIENVTDTAYQTVAGYGAYGRSAFVGVRTTW